MKNYSLSSILAILSAILATSCCLPAFLFLFFGIGVGGLGFLEVFAPYRWILSGLSIGFFILYILNRKKIKCCSKGVYRKYVSIFTLLLILLFYPEFSMLFIEE
jgi:mercuric ion transport protein